MKAVIFDLDDTLYPEYTYIQHWFEQAFALAEGRWGVSKDTFLAEAKQTLGDWKGLEFLDMDGKEQLLLNTLLKCGVKEEIDIKELMKTFSMNKPEHLPLHPGAKEVLEELQNCGLKLAILTNGLKERQECKIRALGIGPFFACIGYAVEYGAEKPNEVGFKEVLSKLQMLPANTVMIGDNPFNDIAPAKALGMKTVRILQGVFKDIQGEEVPQADILVKDISEVPTAIL